MASHELRVGDRSITAEVSQDAGAYAVKVGDRTVKVRCEGEGQYTLFDGNRRYPVAVVRTKDGLIVDIESHSIVLHDLADPGFAGGSGEQHEDPTQVFAPMPGKIVKLLVSVGDSVAVKQPLVIVEAMKMENTVMAKMAGRVAELRAVAGDQVGTDNPLVILEPLPS